MMEYVIYKLYFRTGVHFGMGALSDSAKAFRADTLFSALCIEALKNREEVLEQLLMYTKSGTFVISDAMPFLSDKLFIPKPIVHIEQKQTDEVELTGKQFKNIDYIGAEDLERYMKGEYDPRNSDTIEGLGTYEERDLTAIRIGQDPLPYPVGIYQYGEGNGLYVIAGFGGKEIREQLEELLIGVSLTGIGGKRSSGLGKFDFKRYDVPEYLEKRLVADYGRYMLLSGGLPFDDELEEVLENATYKLSKRSGFVQSESFSDTQQRKRDIYMIDAGSVCNRRFHGKVEDVSSGGAHPVYRYASPLFLGV